MLLAGGTAGVISRTATAPLDRIKLLFQVRSPVRRREPRNTAFHSRARAQVQSMPGSGAAAGTYTSIGQAASKILREEGVLAFWKGNGANAVRVVPYSAAQLASNDLYKRLIARHLLQGQIPDGAPLPVAWRLLAGACAGMTATALTHPLDTLRLRLALPGQKHQGLVTAFSTVVRTEGLGALYKGLVPTLIGIAPYAAINFATYDSLKRTVAVSRSPSCSPGPALHASLSITEALESSPQEAQRWIQREQQERGVNHPLASVVVAGPATNMLVGALAGTTAATVCFPLDTVRRRMQMKDSVYKGQVCLPGSPSLASGCPAAARCGLRASSCPSLGGLLREVVGMRLGYRPGPTTTTLPLFPCAEQLDAMRTMLAKEGVRAFYRGWGANTLKVSETGVPPPPARGADPRRSGRGGGASRLPSLDTAGSSPERGPFGVL